MAEIKIEPRSSGGSVWPWILGLLALLLVGWLVFEAFDEEDELEMTETEAVADPYVTENTFADDETLVAGTVYDYDREYATYQQQYQEMEGNMGLEHEYSQRLMRSLAATISGFATEQNLNNNAQVSQAVETLRQKANAIDNNWRSVQHANMLNQAANAVADAMATIQQQVAPDMQQPVNDIRQAAQQIDPGVQTLNQKDAVKNFFRTSMMALQQMGADVEAG